MKPKEAHEIIEDMAKRLKQSIEHCPPVKSKWPFEHVEALELSAEALRKQIPKKPIPDEVFPEWQTCPVCGKLTEDEEWCQYCGQKLEEEGET